MSRLKEAIEIIGNRFIGLREQIAENACETIWEAVENGEIERCPCRKTVQYPNGQEATIHFPHSHTLSTERGEVTILRLGANEEKKSQ